MEKERTVEIDIEVPLDLLLTLETQSNIRGLTLEQWVVEKLERRYLRAGLRCKGPWSLLSESPVSQTGPESP